MSKRLERKPGDAPLSNAGVALGLAACVVVIMLAGAFLLLA